MGIVRVAEDVETGVVVVGAGGGGGGEVTEPLLRRCGKEDRAELRKIRDEAEASDCGSDGHGDGGSLRMVLLSTAVAVCGSFEFGTCVGYSAPTQSGIVDEVGLSISEFAIFGSILTIGAMIGAVTSGRLADFLGRKMTMRISATICIFGWLSIHLAKSAIMLYFGRILLGFSTGVLSYVVPVFIAEIAPKNLRGGLATSNQLLICSGSSATYIIGALVAWRNLVLVGLVPSVLLLAGLFFIPESPRWLANVGREKEFHTSLQKLRGEDADISEEAIEIKDYIESLRSFPKARLQDLFLSKNIYAVIVGVGLMVFQQLGGINGVGFYASYIFSSAGFSGKLGTILIGIIQIPITLFGAILMDRSGRRVLLMVSASGTFLGCFLTGISFYLKAQGLFPEWVPTLALSGILVYIGAYSIGMGPVPWVVMSEIFSINMKAIGGSLVTLVSWLGSFAYAVIHLFRVFSCLYYWSTSFMALFGCRLVPCAVLLLGLFFIPESPRWLANIGREKEFHASLQKFRGEDSDISEEATEIKGYIESIRRLPKARIQDLFQRKNMYGVTVGVGLMIFQQLGGINALGFYTSYIFSSAGFSGKLGTTLIGIIQVPITLVGALLMDRTGRRALLLVSSSGTFLGCLLTGLSFYFKAQGLYLQLIPTLALCGILVYYAAYSVGMGPVPWVIMSEVFSIDMKAIAGALVTLVSWIGSFAISYSFNFLMDWNPAGTFFLFSASSLVTVLFVAKLVPETKGRTLEEIQASLKAST